MKLVYITRFFSYAKNVQPVISKFLAVKDGDTLDETVRAEWLMVLKEIPSQFVQRV